jgi:hypothetical protein
VIAALLTGIATIPWMRAALRCGATVLAVLLFLLSLRRSGERTGRVVERLEITEKTNAIQRRMLEAAARRPRGRDDLVDRLRNGGF